MIVNVQEALRTMVNPACYDECAVAQERDHCGQVKLRRLRFGCGECRSKFLDLLQVWVDE